MLTPSYIYWGLIGAAETWYGATYHYEVTFVCGIALLALNLGAIGGYHTGRQSVKEGR